MDFADRLKIHPVGCTANGAEQVGAPKRQEYWSIAENGPDAEQQEVEPT